MFKPVTEVFCSFLDRHKTVYNADLVARYSRAMECQLLVKRGEPVGDRGSMYSDGVRTWWDIRIPKNAATEPYWKTTGCRGRRSGTPPTSACRAGIGHGAARSGSGSIWIRSSGATRTA